MNIKIIEDEVDIAVLYKLAIQTEGHEVEIITNDFFNLNNAELWLNTDIAVLDLMLPGYSGENILNYLKANCPWVKVVIVTAALNMVTDTILEAADMVLSKPFRPLDLLVAIESNLTESSQGATVLRRTMHKYIWEGSTVNGARNRKGKL